MISLRQLLGWTLLLALLTAVAVLALRPDPRDALRAADRLFRAGRYYDALRAYQVIDPRALPEAALRLGIVRAIRGEYTPAERALRLAMQGGLRPANYQLALIYLGQVLANDGRAALAVETWALTNDCRSDAACAYRGPTHILQAEYALRQGDYAVAESDYRAALDASPPPPWASLATSRLALLLAARDPGAAIAALGQVATAQAPSADPLLAPLLPTEIAWRGQLVAAISALPESRPFRLGQFYLDLQLYELAEDQFAKVRPGSPNARVAAVYAAYAHWRAGDRLGGRDQLAQIVRTQPTDPQARALLALAYLSADQADAAREQIDTLVRLSPGNPEIHLALANWYIARSEYPQASLEYSLAWAQAPVGRRGHYALLGAQFHLVTAYDLCASGMPLAEVAVTALPTDGAALTTLAAYQYYCGQPGAALASAQRAADSGGGAESVYYLGVALKALGQPDRARSELIRAADLAPASVWRERAETALALMP
ncbi:MAG: tetratricopeptide repeat protein [Chloroflexales bacterium]